MRKVSVYERTKLPSSLLFLPPLFEGGTEGGGFDTLSSLGRQGSALGKQQKSLDFPDIVCDFCEEGALESEERC